MVWLCCLPLFSVLLRIDVVSEVSEVREVREVSRLGISWSQRQRRARRGPECFHVDLEFHLPFTLINIQAEAPPHPQPSKVKYLEVSNPFTLLVV